MAGSQSFYKRLLPKALVSFSSSEGRILFRRALAQGNMESYFDLAAQYVTQSRPEDCARSTLVMALNALYLDPGKVWMNPWRWYSETVLSCLSSKPGMSLHEFARTAQCNGTYVQTFYPVAERMRNSQHLADKCDMHHHEFTVRYASEDTFRTALLASVRREGLIMVVNHSRQALEQTGDGHYSPVAGLDEESDKALVMDVARFKYPPFWVPVSRLYQSLEWIDPETNKMRGFLLLSRPTEYSAACRFSIDTTSLGRIHGKSYTNMLESPHPDFLPLLFFCYYSLGDVFASDHSDLLHEIESLPSFSYIKSGKVDAKVMRIMREVAEEKSDHFLAVISTAVSKSDAQMSPQLQTILEKVRSELGVSVHGTSIRM